MPDINIVLSKQLQNDMLEAPVESGRSIDDVLRRFDVRMASDDQESHGDGYCRIMDVAPDKVDELLGELRNIAGIEAAYVKPADELP